MERYSKMMRRYSVLKKFKDGKKLKQLVAYLPINTLNKIPIIKFNEGLIIVFLEIIDYVNPIRSFPEHFIITYCKQSINI